MTVGIKNITIARVINRGAIRKSRGILAGFLILSLSTAAWGAPELDGHGLPLSCAELLPDTSPFINFFEAVARGTVANDRKFSRRMFRILALREKLGERADRARESNPIDNLIRKTLCFYREQKEPLKPIAYDDTEFMKFIRGSLKDLELKVEDVIFQYEFDRAQRQEYEKRLGKSEGVVKHVRREADDDADRSFDRLSNAAKRKAKAQ